MNPLEKFLQQDAVLCDLEIHLCHDRLRGLIERIYYIKNELLQFQLVWMARATPLNGTLRWEIIDGEHLLVSFPITPKGDQPIEPRDEEYHFASRNRLLIVHPPGHNIKPGDIVQEPKPA